MLPRQGNLYKKQLWFPDKDVSALNLCLQADTMQNGNEQKETVLPGVCSAKDSWERWAFWVVRL